MNLEEKMSKVYEKDEIFFHNNKKPVYNLEQCLKNTSLEVLLNIYDMYRSFVKSYDNLKELTKKEDIEAFLLKNLPDYFKEYVAIFDFHQEFDDLFKTNKTLVPNFILLALGFMFAFQENGKDVYVCPKEFTEIYKSCSALNSEIAYNKFCVVFESSMLIYGFVYKELLLELIKRFNIAVDEKSINRYVKEANLHLYRDKYYLPILPDGISNLLDKVIEFQEKMSPKYLEKAQQNSYLFLLTSYESELADCLKIDINIIQNKMALFLFQPLDPEEIVQQLSGIMKIEQKTKAKLIHIIEEYQDDIRYWIFNGRTEYEYTCDLVRQEMTLKSKPKSDSLKDCLAGLSEKGLTRIKENYHCKKSELEERIQMDFEEMVYSYSREFIEAIINDKEVDFEENIDFEDLSAGFFFVYEDKEVVKYVVPKEIKVIMERIDLNDLESAELYVDDGLLEDYVSRYLVLNGVIEKDKLIDLLKENHDIEITEEDLDSVVLSLQYYILSEKYYCSIEEMDEKDVEELMIAKNKFGKYKKADLERDDFEVQCEEDLRVFIDEEFGFLASKKEALGANCLFLIKMGLFNSEMLVVLLEDMRITLKDSDIRKFTNFVKKFKNVISIWRYNGFTLDEINKISKKEKIGRNELCPCGSGKKYKKCCGK